MIEISRVISHVSIKNLGYIHIDILTVRKEGKQGKLATNIEKNWIGRA